MAGEGPHRPGGSESALDVGKGGSPSARQPRIARVQAAASIELARIAAELRRTCPDVIDLSTGEPDFPTPDHVRAAAVRAMEEGKTRYTPVPGISELREAVSAKFQRENGLSYPAEQTCVAPGAKAIIFMAMLGTLADEDEVIIVAPYWVSYPNMVTLAGGRPVILPTEAADGFRLDPQRLRNALTERTRWIFLNAPSNPAGVCYSEAELQAIGEVLAERSDILIMADEIYEDYHFGERPPSFAAAVPWLKPRTLTVNGVSKSHGMTGWRIGYAGGPPEVIGGMVRALSHATANACSISQWAAVAALNGPASPAIQLRETYRRRRDAVVAGLDSVPGLHCSSPDGAFYAFASCEALIGRRTPAGTLIDSDYAFARELMLAEHVAVVFGGSFGAPGHFRLCFAAPLDVLARACAGIERFCRSLS